jgi:hypothetical protein
VGSNRYAHFPSSGPNIHQEYVDEKLANALSKMQKSKEEGAAKPPLQPSEFSSLGIFEKQQHRYLKRKLK